MPRRWTNAGAQGGGPVLWLEDALHKEWALAQVDWRVRDREQRFGKKRNPT